ncbi:MAG: hypothetical protein P8099_06170 [Gemmatimonadota bacterium]|jgi:hypothetical protein
MPSTMSPVRYSAPDQFLCAAAAQPATCLSELTERIAERLRDAFGNRPADVSEDCAAHQVVVSVRDPIPDGGRETGTYVLSATVRLFGLRWEGAGDGRRLRGQVAVLGEVWRLDDENDFAWYVRDRHRRLGMLMDEVRTLVKEVTDALDA